MSNDITLPGKQRYTDKKILFASGAHTVGSANGTAVELPGGMTALGVMLDVTNAATASDDTLDVFIQTSMDGVNYVDVHHFTQVLGNGSNTLRYYAAVGFGDDEAEFEDGATLAAAASRSLAGVTWRARYTIVDASTQDATFTFSVTATPM